MLVNTYKMTFLGFDIDSLNMASSLAVHKIDKTQSICREVIHCDAARIDKVAGLLLHTVAYFKAVELGPFH